MGEAKRRREGDAIVSVLIPERGRPDQLERCIASLIDTAGDDERYEVLVAIDDDDPAWQGEKQPFEHARTRYFRWPRPLTLGIKVNLLAKEARGDIFFAISNDYLMETPGWPGEFRAAVKSLPNGIGIPFPHDDRHPDHAAFPIISKQTARVLNFVWPPVYPYWFVDTHIDQLGVLLGVRWEIPVTIRHQGGDPTESISGRVDLAFWAEFFQGLAPVRFQEGLRLIDAAWPGNDNPERIAALKDLQHRQQVCAARAAHLSHPAFLERFAATDNTPPYPGYVHAKEAAEAMLADIRKQTPRRLRVAVATPSGRTWEASTACAIAALVGHSTQHGIEVTIANVQSSAITHGRNATVEICLQSGADYIMWWDSDIVAPPDTLVRLLKHQKDITGATYSRRTPPFGTLGRLSGERLTDAELAKGGILRAEVLPGGLLLVNIEVYRKLKWPWYAECYKWVGDDNLDAFKRHMAEYFTAPPPSDVLDSIDASPFGEWVKDHYSVALDAGSPERYFSEDLFLCRKAKAAGFEIWCDLDLTFQTIHLGALQVSCDRPTPEARAGAAQTANISLPFLSGDMAPAPSSPGSPGALGVAAE